LAELPEVGAQLSGVGELGAVVAGAQLELLHDVRHRSAHEAEGDPVRAFEADCPKGRGGQAAGRGVVSGEDDVSVPSWRPRARG
jgi:hypothetical protein